MHRPRPTQTQRGVALVIVLIALVILMISGVALVKSFGVSMTQSGNLAFKRDLKNEAERAVLTGVTLLTSGALSTETARIADSLSNNYSATRLASNSYGVPLVLTDDSRFSSAGMTGADITDTNTGVTLRYVIDRQCQAAGEITATTCVTMSESTDSSVDGLHQQIKSESRPIYRISVRASGPRNTQVFIQTTVVR